MSRRTAKLAVVALVCLMLPTIAHAAALQQQATTASFREKLLHNIANASAVPPAFKANETCALQLLLCGQYVQTSLAATDCSVTGGYGDLWVFPSYHTQLAAVAVLPTGFDALFGMVDPAGTVLDASVARSGNAEAVAAYLHPHGNYHALVADYSSTPNATGNYSLLLGCDGFDTVCTPDATNLCLARKRFRVQVGWHNQYNDTYGFGSAIARTNDAGFFTFGDPNNIELLVKILDFGGGDFKVFYGELTNLEFEIAVTDMVADKTKTYTNTPGDCGAIDPDFRVGAQNSDPTSKVSRVVGCHPDSQTACLLNSRFALTMQWHNQYDGSAGTGKIVPLSNLTTAFYFTTSSNLEVVAKMIDFGDRVAVYYGALSDLEYTMTITDTTNGQTKSYHNPPGKFCGGLDDPAFH